MLAAAAAVAGATAVLLSAEPPAPDRLYTPADVYTLAAEDAAKGGAAARSWRYLSLHNLPAADRPIAVQVLGGFVNSLSREPDITRPVPIAGGLLLRIDTQDYGSTFAKAWEKLAEQEPYFHVSTVSQSEEEYETVKVDYGLWVSPDGTKSQTRQSDRDTWEHSHYKEERKKRAKINTGRTAPWVVQGAGKKAFETLTALTQSDVPAVTGEWLIVQAAIQADRRPGYYDFLGIKDEATFQQVVGFTEKGVDPGFLRELRESVAVSGVTLQPRAIERKEKIGGALWRTRDIRIARDRSNPLRVLDGSLQFDATEQYGHLPNGLWATALFDSKGTRQDSAPDFVASDSTAPHNDRRVHVHLSCTRCHVEGGLQDIDGWVRNVLNAPPNFLAAKDPAEARQLRQQYVRRLEPHLADDRLRYSRAIAEATGGLTPEKYAAGLAKLWEERAERPVDVSRAALDLGCSVEALQKKLADAGPGVDPVLSAFRLPKPRPIPVTSWQESYQNAQLLMGGYALIPPKSK